MYVIKHYIYVHVCNNIYIYIYTCSHTDMNQHTHIYIYIFYCFESILTTSPLIHQIRQATLTRRIHSTQKRLEQMIAEESDDEFAESVRTHLSMWMNKPVLLPSADQQGSAAMRCSLLMAIVGSGLCVLWRVAASSKRSWPMPTKSSECGRTAWWEWVPEHLESSQPLMSTHSIFVVLSFGAMFFVAFRHF